MISKETAKKLITQLVEDNDEGRITPQRMRASFFLIIDDVYDEMAEYDRRIGFLEDAAANVQ
jgi:hypothetical protein